MLRPPPISTLFPYTTLFRSLPGFGLHRHPRGADGALRAAGGARAVARLRAARAAGARSEEHTSELQSHSDLVCRLLLEKKKILDWTDFIVIDDADQQCLCHR